MSTPRGLSSRIPTKLSTVVSSAYVRSIVGPGGGGGSVSPALLASRQWAFHSRISRSYSSFLALNSCLFSAWRLRTGLRAALAAGVFFSPGEATTARKSVAPSLQLLLISTTLLAPIPAESTARAGSARRSGAHPIASAPSSTNLRATSGSASVGKGGSSGSGGGILGRTTPFPEGSPFLLTTRVAPVA